ncbi:ComEC/Rec2 family competence protein [Tsukamurella sp. 8F]|uniref:ComEC/Rec2 family competence protein n=1 Tax=unclassified Tsukamurella TaxID=2633480 RepID=UPI0023B94011|nr:MULTISPECIES: ComEC/Rec2 family competence protein [unclassified Tsukamurella]MDF0532246.1 ComEC/Rec2 family competence protein [Tsukamurella sp. 8J]MDF0588058.1 ComEC/Rec2 family competence protein [Tsukamurella sp. 8F]
MAARIDLRLLPTVAVVWPTTIVCLRQGFPWIALAASLAMLAAVFAAALVRTPRAAARGGRRVAWAVLGAMALGAGAATGTGLRADLRDAAPIAARDGDTVLAHVHVDEWARQLGSRAGHLDTSRALVPATALAVGDPPDDAVFQAGSAGGAVPARDRVLLIGRAADLGPAVPGERWEVEARVLRSDRAGLASAVLLVSRPPREVGPAPPWYGLAAAVRRSFTAVSGASLPGLHSGLLPALVLGDETGTAPTVRGDFTAAGMTHLTAVSGANFAIVTLCVAASCSLVGMPRRVRVAVTGAAVIGFAGLVGPTGSVVRAAVMGLFGVAAVALRRGRQPVSALAAAVVLLLLARPQLAVDIGFALSVAATAGLLLWAPAVTERLHHRGVPRPLAGLVALTVVAQIVTVPLVVAVSGTLPLGAFPANLLAGPAVPVLTVLGTVGALLAVPAPALAQLPVRATRPEVGWLLTVARWFADWPQVPVPGGSAAGIATALGGLGVGAVWQHVRRGRRAGARGGGNRGPPGGAGDRNHRGSGPRGGRDGGGDRG